MPRLFTALELPEHVVELLSQLPAPLEHAYWVPAHDLHMTLRFVGEITRRQADMLANNLADLMLPPPRIRIIGTSAFGGKSPHALYATVETTPELDELARAHDKAARNLGLDADKRKFVPHVTLARLQSTPVEPVARWLESTGGLQVPAFWPTRAVLMSARDGGGGPYGVVDAFPFQGQIDEDDEDLS
jgi:RNA 2',3'-cyclic 3'-phosphodiesterase